LEKIAAENELTVVDFWAYWCGPCRANFPHLKDVYNRYKDKGLAVYAISIDTSYKQWVEAIKQEKLTWNNVVLDKLGQEAELYGITAVPTSFLLDKKGKIIAHWVGDMSTLEPTIKQYLKM
jgi:thiol-disulfide isomerase/thioredoxin